MFMITLHTVEHQTQYTTEQQQFNAFFCDNANEMDKINLTILLPSMLIVLRSSYVTIYICLHKNGV